MAFFHKTKAAGSNLANRIGQSLDNAEYDNKIGVQRGLRNKLISEVGQLTYEIYLDGKKTFTEEVMDLMQQIEDCEIEIERLEQEKADNIAARKEERRTNMEQAYDADDARDQERAARAAERRERREAEKAQREAEMSEEQAKGPEPEPEKPAKKAAPKKAAPKKAAPKKDADKPAPKSKKKAE